ncbi:MAG: DUF5110 domain-containing protein, partial [Acidobacteriota bacterium]
LNAWSSGTKPWSFPEVEKEVREVTQLRMRLLPYLYTTFAQYQFDGIPPVRAMQLVDGFIEGDGEVESDSRRSARRRSVQDQFMFGDSLLIAPLFAGQTQRDVLLPSGRWYDFYTGELAGESEVITAEPGLEQIPVYVRDGGIVPLIEARRQMPRSGERLDLEVRHYGTLETSFELYDDDGLTFDYEEGAYSWTRLGARLGSDGVWTGAVERDRDEKPFAYEAITWTFMGKGR